jgi:hypothetical protein
MTPPLPAAAVAAAAAAAARQRCGGWTVAAAPLAGGPELALPDLLVKPLAPAPAAVTPMPSAAAH